MFPIMLILWIDGQQGLLRVKSLVIFFKLQDFFITKNIHTVYFIKINMNKSEIITMYEIQVII